jgi:hypothetical protein
MFKATRLIVLGMALVVVVGCAGGVGYEGAVGAGGPITDEFPVPVAEVGNIMVQSFRPDSTTLQVASSSQGLIETSWEEHPGSTHGIWFWKRVYLARTRYTIQYEPAFSDPASRSVVEIYWSTEERPNDKYPWESADLDWGQGRSLELMNRIRKLVQDRSIGG